LAPAIAKEIRT